MTPPPSGGRDEIHPDQSGLVLPRRYTAGIVQLTFRASLHALSKDITISGCQISIRCAHFQLVSLLPTFPKVSESH